MKTLHHRISVRAYFLHLSEGGDALTNWLDAERKEKSGDARKNWLEAERKEMSESLIGEAKRIEAKRRSDLRRNVTSPPHHQRHD